jgi:hypothetical protein
MLMHHNLHSLIFFLSHKELFELIVLKTGDNEVEDDAIDAVAKLWGFLWVSREGAYSYKELTEV